MDEIIKPTNLDWVQLHEDMNIDILSESAGQRIIRKCKSQPLVPLGALITLGALTLGLKSFVQGNKSIQQTMMRVRVGAQLFTVLAATSGVIFKLSEDRKFNKSFIKSDNVKTEKSES